MSEGKLRVVGGKVCERREKWLKEGEAINQSINDDVRTRWSPDSEVAWHGGVNSGVRGHMREARGRQGRTAEVAGG
jgi:hypothetical protein